MDITSCGPHPDSVGSERAESSFVGEPHGFEQPKRRLVTHEDFGFNPFVAEPKRLAQEQGYGGGQESVASSG